MFLAFVFDLIELGDPDLVEEAWEEIFVLFRKQFKQILGVLRAWYQSEYCWWWCTGARRPLGLGLSCEARLGSESLVQAGGCMLVTSSQRDQVQVWIRIGASTC